MLIIKLWWSVFAPKDSDFFDREYLKNFHQFLGQFHDDIFFIHWAGNVWHTFVAQNGLTQESFNLWRREVRNQLWQPFEEIFSDYQRIDMEDLLMGRMDIQKLWKKSIVWGDIATNLQILSWDEAFSFMMKENHEKNGYMVTDIDWVLDLNGKLINVLPISDLDKIHFWKKEGDAQNSMYTKILSLKNWLSGSGAIVWILHGNNLPNLQSVIVFGNWVGTKIVL